MRTIPRIPWLARTLLYVFVPAAINEPLIGDMDACYYEIAEERGAGAARHWYWFETRRTLRDLLVGRAIGRSPETHGTFRGEGFMIALLADLRFAVRLLLRRPVFSALAVLTLAIGIGASTAIFSAVRPVLLDPLPYPNADRIAAVWESEADGSASNLGFTTFSDFEERSKSFEVMAAMGTGSGILTGDGDPMVVDGLRVTPGFLQVLGVRPMIGRDFRSEENTQSSPRVMILSYRLWRDRFHADSGVVGRIITLSGNAYTVVGVMGREFENLLEPKAQTLALLRYAITDPYACRDCRHLRVIGKLKPTITSATAQRELSGLLAQIAQQFASKYSSTAVQVPLLKHDLTKDMRTPLLLLSGAVVVLLLIACANVANLLIARGTQREGELAVRSALGAGRGRILQQLLTESLVLSLAAGAVGTVVAALSVSGLVALAPLNLPRRDAIALDSGALMFAALLCAGVGLLCGVFPAIHASRSTLQGGMKRLNRQIAGARRARGAFVVAEVALALTLLICTGLLVRSAGRLLTVSPGFDAREALSLRLQTGGIRYRSDTVTRAFFHDVLEQTRAIPGVTHAGLTSQLPLSGDFDAYGVHAVGSSQSNPALDPSGFRYAVSAGYLEAMHIPVRSGRTFTDADRAGAERVAAVSHALAQQLWPRESALGKLIRVGSITDSTRTVVAVVGNVHQVSLDNGNLNAVYLPASQWDFADGTMSLVVRSSVNTGAVTRAVREIVRNVDRDQPITLVAPMSEVVASSASSRRFTLVLFEAFGIAALILAGSGLYGVMSGRVAERLREIGVRLALGATSRDIATLILREGAMLAMAGMVLGLLATAAIVRTLDNLLFGVGRADTITYVAATFLLTTVAALSCAVPAIRAARLDPLVALRSD